MNGIIVVDKPQDYTSFDVIAILRKKLNQKKIGHMGTLDPMATGVLPILLGQTAKLQIFVEENEKEYLAEIKFGITTDTWDIFGRTLFENPSNVQKSDLECVLSKFKGKLNQFPPMYSAIKVDGVKLCDLARKGIEIERKPRQIYVSQLDLIDFNEINQTAKIKVYCSKGTYIRSLCFDIGKALGCGASMGNLRRTISNSFTLNESIPLKKIEELEAEELIHKYILPSDYLFRNKSSIHLNNVEAKAFKNGANLKFSSLHLTLKNEEIVRLYSENIFLGLGKVDYKNQMIKFLKCIHKE